MSLYWLPQWPILTAIGGSFETCDLLQLSLVPICSTDINVLPVAKCFLYCTKGKVVLDI